MGRSPLLFRHPNRLDHHPLHFLSAHQSFQNNGKPLSGNDGPFELVVPGEKRSARWVRQVTSLKIRQAN
jgi:hypothetical protein